MIATRKDEYDEEEEEEEEEVEMMNTRLQKVV